MAKIIFEVTKETKKKFKTICIEENKTMTEILRGFVNYYVKKNGS